MKRLVQSTRSVLAGVALFGATAHQATAQFAAVNNYAPARPATAPNYGPAGYAAQPNPEAAYQGYVAPTPSRAPAPAQAPAAPVTAYRAPAIAYQQPAPAYAAPAYAYPRVAQAAELPAPTETLQAEQPEAPTSPDAYGAPSANYSAPVTQAPAAPMQYEGSYAQPTGHASYPPASDACATGDCEAGYAPTTVGYGAYDNGYAPACDPAPACDLGVARPKRQWFAGVYGLYLDRAGDDAKRMVAYMTDTGVWTPPPGDPGYYPMPSDPTLFTADAGDDGQFGGEIRFGSTFGCDPCGCGQPFAWEVGYWALDDDSSSATLILPGTLSSTNTQRLYSTFDYSGLMADLDGAGTTWDNRPIYQDDGMPADRDTDANDVRILGVRVRQRFQVQNLELNFWRFGTPAAAPSCGIGCYDSCNTGCDTGACGVTGCGPQACAPCQPCRPPRRFFINGLAGVRYLRVDDDFGLDWQQAPVDTDPASPTYGDPPSGWPATYSGLSMDDNSVFFSDYEADNELVGFQLGCSMNWLFGCRWNVFADTNFGVYGNNAEVYKRVYGGGASVVTWANGGGPVAVRGSETTVSYVGELRAGLGYQVSGNCRLTAAYRFIGIGGVALGVEELQNTVWANPEVASHIDTNNSIILHGLQTGVEFKY